MLSVKLHPFTRFLGDMSDSMANSAQSSNPSDAAPATSAAPMPTRFAQGLSQHIRQQPHQRISFAEFMDWALYQPGGYYSGSPGIGPQGQTAGDFVTSPHLCADFGELLAVQLIDMWERLDRPQPFQVVEMGAGHGLLAVDILRYLSREAPQISLDYKIVERSPLLQRSQQQQLKAGLAPQLLDNIHWHSWEDLSDQSITGCFLSNELVDAFPVHLVEVQGAETNRKLVELQVEASDADGSAEKSGFTFVPGELSEPELEGYFSRFALPLTAYPEGYRTEINLAAQGWMERVASKLARGYCLTIDYGYKAERYYQASRRGGTLQCYFQHSYHDDPFINVGQQDITAHVNFTALEQWGEAVGLQSLGFTQQGLFLMALGLGDRLQALASDATDIRAVGQMIQRREQLHGLMNPMGLGNFGVLLQAKGLSSAELDKPLKGLVVPAWGS